MKRKTEEHREGGRERDGARETRDKGTERGERVRVRGRDRKEQDGTEGERENETWRERDG